MDQFNQLVFIVSVLKLFTNVSQVINVKFSLSGHVQQVEVLFSSFLRERRSESGGKFSQESFEVKSLSLSGIVNIRDESEDDFVFGVKSEGLSGLEEISAISSSLSGVSVKGEESVELSDVFW